MLTLFALLLVDAGRDPLRELTSTDWCMPVLLSGLENGGTEVLHFERAHTFHFTYYRPVRNNGPEAQAPSPKRGLRGTWRFSRQKIVLRPSRGAEIRLSWVLNPDPRCIDRSMPECASSSPIPAVLTDGESLLYSPCAPPMEIPGAKGHQR